MIFFAIFNRYTNPIENISRKKGRVINYQDSEYFWIFTSRQKGTGRLLERNCSNERQCLRPLAAKCEKEYDSYRATEYRSCLKLSYLYTNELPHLPLVTFLQSSHYLETKGNCVRHLEAKIIIMDTHPGTLALSRRRHLCILRDMIHVRSEA